MAEGSLQLSEGWGDPGQERGEHSWQWLHVPARGELVVVMLSESPVRYRGHWIDGRMRPCMRVGCLYCSRKLGGQYRYAFSVLDVVLKARALLEVGAFTAEQIRGLAEEYGTLRGLDILLTKEGQRERGRIIARRAACRIDRNTLPEAEDPAQALTLGWR